MSAPVDLVARIRAAALRRYAVAAEAGDRRGRLLALMELAALRAAEGLR